MKTLDGLPIIKRCAWCNEWIDEQSKLIAETRDKTRYVVSHTICPECLETLNLCEELDFADDLTN